MDKKMKARGFPLLLFLQFLGYLWYCKYSFINRKIKYFVSKKEN